jgi:hypothetical protein
MSGFFGMINAIKELLTLFTLCYVYGDYGWYYLNKGQRICKKINGLKI